MLKAKLDAACARLDAEAAQAAEQARPAFDAKQAAWQAKKGRRGRPPVPPDPAAPPERQTNLTDPDSALMRRSDHHECRQAYNAQAVVDADGSQRVLATHVTRCPVDAPSFLALILAMAAMTGLPHRVLADAGFANGEAVAGLQQRGIDPLVAVGRTQPHRPYDVRPPPKDEKPPRTMRDPWRIAMTARMETDDAKAHYKKRKQTVEPVFGVIKSAIGFRRFSMRGIGKAATEWTLVTLAYNCKRMTTLLAA